MFLSGSLFNKRFPLEASQKATGKVVGMAVGCKKPLVGLV
jgi:hypothetical protein